MSPSNILSPNLMENEKIEQISNQRFKKRMSSKVAPVTDQEVIMEDPYK